MSERASHDMFDVMGQVASCWDVTVGVDEAGRGQKWRILMEQEEVMTKWF